MNGGLAIVTMRATDAYEEVGITAPADGGSREEHVVVEDYAEPAPAGLTRATWTGWTAVAASVLWVAALVFLARDAFAAMSPLALAQFGAAAATVPALAGILWIASLRTSQSEARRFATTAHAMRVEAQALESSVAVLGEQIELRRQELAEQVRLLTALAMPPPTPCPDGRHLSEEKIDTADVHARALTAAAETAQAKLEHADRHDAARRHRNAGADDRAGARRPHRGRTDRRARRSGGGVAARGARLR
ncbi:hypothetical protein AB5I41_17790 [Sphingomonas sp. MMS24-JH45]